MRNSGFGGLCRHANPNGVAPDPESFNPDFGVNTEIGGHGSFGHQKSDAPSDEGQRTDGHQPRIAFVAPTQIEGQFCYDIHDLVALKGGGQTLATSPERREIAPLPPHLSEIVELQRQRKFCIKSQSRANRSCEAFIARYLGYRPDMPKDQGAGIWKQAAALRTAVEKGTGLTGNLAQDPQVVRAFTACAPIILNSAQSRQSWDTHRGHVEESMRKAARALPAWQWVEGVKGFGDLGLAIIVGETGDLGSYATKERVWKRLGLAVINGDRQQRKTGAEAAAAHGYSPSRRAEVWTLADSLFKHQWAGDKDEDGANPKKTKKPVAVPAHATGPYGQVYANRKAHTATRDEWTPMRRENDARRIATKALVEDVWRVWRGRPALEHPPRAGNLVPSEHQQPESIQEGGV